MSWLNLREIAAIATILSIPIILTLIAGFLIGKCQLY